MSTHRVSPEAGWANLKGMPTGPNGRRLCRFCKQEVPKGRRTFCSDPCVHEWRVRSDPNYVRIKVRERDRGVCAACGLDTEAFRREFRKQLSWSDFEAAMKVRGFHDPHGHLWEADHIVPVSEGGGECGLDNYRTLCIPCHKQETKNLHQRRAEQRTGQQPLPTTEEDLMTATKSDTIEPIDETEPDAGDQNPPSGETIPGTDDTTSELSAGAQASGCGQWEDPVADDPMVEETRTDRYLDRDLTDEERLTIGEEMAEALRKAEQLEADKAAYDKDMKDRITMHYEQATTLAKALQEGRRKGTVEVVIRKDWHTGTLTVTRPETGEVLEERAMTFDERQRGLNLHATDNEIDTAEEAAEDARDAEIARERLRDIQENPDAVVTTPVGALAETAGEQVGHA